MVAMTDKEIKRIRAERRLKIARDNYAIQKSLERVIRDQEDDKWIRRLHKFGLPLATIAEAAELPIEEIKRVLNID